MATNRFKKSIETATDNTQETLPQNIKETATDNTKVIVTQDTPETKPDNANNSIVENAPDNAPTNIGSSILESILKSSKKDRGKNYTIYLSADVGDALDKQSQDSGMSKSELVDKILRAVLLEK